MKKLITAISSIMLICAITSFAFIKSDKYEVMTKAMQEKMTPEDALEKLKAGNRRFLSGETIHHDRKNEVAQTSAGQYPYAVLLSCIDSRTSSEIIFDENLGDIFNARIAGNYANTDIIGSMEFACKVAGAKLVVVVGHSKCGAIKGACDKVELGNLTHVIQSITPAVDSIQNISGDRNSKNEAFVKAVALKNVALTITKIRSSSPILREMENKGQIKIVGAMYDVTSGKVDFIN
jgi:carbonic anhydrase